MCDGSMWVKYRTRLQSSSKVLIFRWFLDHEDGGSRKRVEVFSMRFGIVQ